MARRNFSRRPQRPLRLSQWAATVPETQFIALAAATSVIDSSFTPSGAAPETVIRTRGLLTVMTDQVAASEQPFGAFGICVVSDQAFTAGVASVPTPYTEAESDLWFLHTFWSAAMLSATQVGFDGRVAYHFELDSKAMRKVNEDETIIAVMENGNSTDGILYRLDFRILGKLS